MSACASAADGMVHNLVDSVDCHIRTLAHDSYRDLVGPGTPFATAFTAMLTIYIALIGYQLLLGRGGLRLTSLPVMALKIGLIMAFVTSWASYQTVIFSLLFDGPRDILTALMRSMRNSGFDGDVYDGIEGAYRVLSDAATTYGAQASPAANILQGGPMLGAGLLWLCAIGALLITVGVILAAKIVLGFLLAVGPVFVAFLLFDRTRGLFEGWLRAALGFAIVPLAVNVFGAAMLVVLAPFLTTISESAEAGVFDMSPIVTVGLIVANVIVFVFESASGVSDAVQASFALVPRELFDVGILGPGEATYSQEALAIPERTTLLSYMFMHGDVMHLLGNMLFLWVFGDNVEDAMGHVRYLAFYLLCGVVAGLTHAFMMPTSDEPLIGASGAVSGVIAAYLMLHPRVRVWVLALKFIPLRISAAWVLGLWIFTQFAMVIFPDASGTAWWAHIGGLFAGAALILVMRKPGVALFQP